MRFWKYIKDEILSFFPQQEGQSDGSVESKNSYHQESENVEHNYKSQNAQSTSEALPSSKGNTGGTNGEEQSTDSQTLDSTSPSAESPENSYDKSQDLSGESDNSANNDSQEMNSAASQPSGSEDQNNQLQNAQSTSEALLSSKGNNGETNGEQQQYTDSQTLDSTSPSAESPENSYNQSQNLSDESGNSANSDSQGINSNSSQPSENLEQSAKFQEDLSSTSSSSEKGDSKEAEGEFQAGEKQELSNQLQDKIPDLKDALTSGASNTLDDEIQEVNDTKSQPCEDVEQNNQPQNAPSASEALPSSKRNTGETSDEQLPTDSQELDGADQSTESSQNSYNQSQDLSGESGDSANSDSQKKDSDASQPSESENQNNHLLDGSSEIVMPKEEVQEPGKKDGDFDSESQNLGGPKELDDSKSDEQPSDCTKPDSETTIQQKRELLERFKNAIDAAQKQRAKHLRKEQLTSEKPAVEESKEEHYDFSEQTNEFLNKLRELPSFEDRNRGPGYSIDTQSYTEVPDSVIRTLINKFLNQRFCKHNTDLNVRSNSLEKTDGFYKWEIKDVIQHLQTNQVTKVLTDKYGYQYAQGKSENVPLSFYFDLSGSMSSYTNMLAVIAIELLKKGVKVLVGFNEQVNVQIDSIENNITVSELAEILESAGYWGFQNLSIKDQRIKYKYIGRNIDNYLIERKAEKCVVFADFDPISEIKNLSQALEVYWFCFESSFDSSNLKGFNGFIYKVQSLKDLEQGLLKVNEKRFETLCYTDNPNGIQKKVRVKK